MVMLIMRGLRSDRFDRDQAPAARAKPLAQSRVALWGILRTIDLDQRMLRDASIPWTVERNPFTLRSVRSMGRDNQDLHHTPASEE